MVNAFKSFWKNTFNYNGRTTRSGYWYVVLMHLIIGFIVGFIGGFISAFNESVGNMIIGLTYVYSIIGIIPSIALIIRRLHDINKSGWWYFICLVPLVGTIILLVFFCTASVDENNNYGETV